MTTAEQIRTSRELMDDIDSDFKEAKKMNAQYREHEFNKISNSLREIRAMLGIVEKV